jgi:hypothetical protein
VCRAAIETALDNLIEDRPSSQIKRREEKKQYYKNNREAIRDQQRKRREELQAIAREANKKCKTGVGDIGEQQSGPKGAWDKFEERMVGQNGDS